ncbi:MAG: 50S ribosomal protein L21 [Chitinispirillaceae bacterium]|nr:50S ribosomal protein L21 [Chitinispirillaceae bacterium]
MYSIIEQGGMQFKVTPGATVQVPLIDAEPGSEICIDKVLLSAEGESVSIGTPYIKDAKVTAKVVGHLKGEKVLVIKKIRRKDYRRKNGHRQRFTKLEILSLTA